MSIKEKNQNFKLKSIWLQSLCSFTKTGCRVGKHTLAWWSRDQIQVVTLSVISYVVCVVFLNCKVGLVHHLPWRITARAQWGTCKKLRYCWKDMTIKCSRFTKRLLPWNNQEYVLPFFWGTVGKKVLGNNLNFYGFETEMPFYL